VLFFVKVTQKIAKPLDAKNGAGDHCRLVTLVPARSGG
jgi:hypothetical protein